jgi:glycosyltransferase involved in cell wall biosynthesis
MNQRSPLRVAISHVTASYAVGGSETYVWNLAKFLAERGQQVRILAGACENPNRYFSGIPLDLFPFRRREQFPKLGTRFRKLMERLSFGWSTRRSLFEHPCDILNIHKPYDLPVAAWIRKRTGCKVIWRCHGRDYFAGLRYWLRHADAIYCVSEFARQDLISDYPVPAEVIYTGVDTDFFQPATSLAPPGGVPQVLYFGRLEGWKGIRHLVQAFHELSGVEFTGRIVGDGPDRETLAQMLNDLRLTPKISLEPAVRGRENVRTLLTAADIVVFPAVAVETLSNAMLEAMGLGKAIVATRVGGFAEVLEDHQTAILVEPRSPSALAAAIRELLGAPELRTTLGKGARQDAIERFQARRSFEQVEQLFQRVRG